jgi:hypothetical protein
MDMMKDLANIIPVFFVADEIQEFQKLTLKSVSGAENETGLHYFARLMKNLLRSKILVMLSGTRYHILSQIGGAIGSPIRGKVLPFIITRLDVSEISSYKKVSERQARNIVTRFEENGEW